MYPRLTLRQRFRPTFAVNATPWTECLTLPPRPCGLHPVRGLSPHLRLPRPAAAECVRSTAPVHRHLLPGCEWQSFGVTTEVHIRRQQLLYPSSQQQSSQGIVKSGRVNSAGSRLASTLLAYTAHPASRVQRRSASGRLSSRATHWLPFPHLAKRSANQEVLLNDSPLPCISIFERDRLIHPSLRSYISTGRTRRRPFFLTPPRLRVIGVHIAPLSAHHWAV